jgi:hypothetical protein
MSRPPLDVPCYFHADPGRIAAYELHTGGLEGALNRFNEARLEHFTALKPSNGVGGHPSGGRQLAQIPAESPPCRSALFWKQHG